MEGRDLAVQADMETGLDFVLLGQPDDAPLLPLPANGIYRRTGTGGCPAREGQGSDVFSLGRAEHNDICLPFAGVSVRHAVVFFDDGPCKTWKIRDLGSGNGTFVEGRRLQPDQPQALALGQPFWVANVGLRLEQTSTSDQQPNGLVRQAVSDLMVLGQSDPVPAQLVIQQGATSQRSMSLFPSRCPVCIGRSEEAGLCIDDRDVSRLHVEVDWTLDGYVLKDLGSKNGTLLNGRVMKGVVRLKHLDVIRLGKAELRFESVSEEPESAALAPAEDANALALTPDVEAHRARPESDTNAGVHKPLNGHHLEEAQGEEAMEETMAGEDAIDRLDAAKEVPAVRASIKRTVWLTTAFAIFSVTGLLAFGLWLFLWA